MIAAIVLAGGRSRRLGTEKAMVLFNDEPLVATAARRLLHKGFSLAINAPEISGAGLWAAANAYPVLSDDPADPAGPLAGLKAGLVWASTVGAEVLASAPCDTPYLPDQLESQLLEQLTPAANAAVVRGPSGLHSLCAVWRVEPTLNALIKHFAAGRHPAVHDLLAELAAVEVAFPADAPFSNLNTWEDMAQAEQ